MPAVGGHKSAGADSSLHERNGDPLTGGAMHRGRLIEAPPPRTAVSPWVEISAWLLAFAILLGAHCAPERASTELAAQPSAETVQR